jgi:hypothetical protein
MLHDVSVYGKPVDMPVAIVAVLPLQDLTVDGPATRRGPEVTVGRSSMSDTSAPPSTRVVRLACAATHRPPLSVLMPFVTLLQPPSLLSLPWYGGFHITQRQGKQILGRVLPPRSSFF